MDVRTEQMFYAATYRLRRFAASIGKKPGRDTISSMLLPSTDLSKIGFVQYLENVRRIVTYRTPNDEFRRARAAGGLTASRAFRRSFSGETLVIQISEFASPEDASAAMRRSSTRVVIRPASKNITLDNRTSQEVVIADLTDPFAYEQKNVRSSDSGGFRLIGGSVGKFVLFINYSSRDEMTLWTELELIAANQAFRIKKCSESAE